MTAIHVLLVDDHRKLREPLAIYLRRQGLEATTAADATRMKALLAQQRFDVIVLDVMLPDGDGFSLCRELRQRDTTPIILLTARGEVDDRVLGLEQGADDYLTKPFLMQELLLRVQHILQRAYRAELQRGAAGRLALGARTVELADALVRLPDGRTLPLTATERALLQKLAENRGHIVTYDALFESVWGQDYFGGENTLGVHIRHLREKIEDNASKPRYLLTVRGIGYKLAGEDTP